MQVSVVVNAVVTPRGIKQFDFATCQRIILDTVANVLSSLADDATNHPYSRDANIRITSILPNASGVRFVEAP